MLEVFFPYLQNEWAAQMTAYLRSNVAPLQMFPAFGGVLRRLGPSLPVYLMKSEERQRDDFLAVELLAAGLSGAFGVLATVLAGSGGRSDGLRREPPHA